MEARAVVARLDIGTEVVLMMMQLGVHRYGVVTKVSLP
jgi:hypothetical protein